MESDGDRSTDLRYCAWCCNRGSLQKVCTLCHSVAYCSAEHQSYHWNMHKLTCQSYQNDEPMAAAAVNSVPSNIGNCFPSILSEATNVGVISPDLQYSLSDWYLDEAQGQQISLNVNMPSQANCVNQNTDVSIQRQDIPATSEDLLAISKEYLFSDNFLNCNADSLSLDVDCMEKIIDEIISNQSSEAQEENEKGPDSRDLEFPLGFRSRSDFPLDTICSSLVNDLNEYGICVVDNFFGRERGELILREVKNLFQKGVFQKGQLVSSGNRSENIRGDVITWVNGNETHCQVIGMLIRKLDEIVARSNEMENNGILSKYKLTRRTKAMVACYPGDGTHYKKHIDNPCGDGRCITCIYYLNKSWNVKEHGGLLRMFPINMDEVANIEPIFDRMLFFWSDKRNPHEVLPSFAIRFAITVWYLDADERDRAVKKFQLEEKE